MNISKVKSNLENNGYNVILIDEKENLISYFENNVGLDKTVAFGGSLTCVELGICDFFQERGNKIFGHWLCKTDEERRNAMRQALTADVYISSANAITEEGGIFNVDGTGNRVAALNFGPEKTYIIVGENKIVEDIDKALIRLHTKTAPRNAKRLNRDTPCVKTGICMNCDCKDRICNTYSYMLKRPRGTNITVIIVKGAYGL